MGFNCLKAAEPLLGDSLLFTTKFKAEISVTPSTGFEIVYEPSYYQILIKATICQTDSIMALNCELCQSEFSVLSDRLIIKLSKIYFVCTYVDQMIIQ